MAGVDKPRIESAVRQILAAIGEDPARQEFAETPMRVAEAYAELFAGVGKDPAVHLTDLMPVGDSPGDAVIVKDIELRSVCEHHLLPFRGRCHIAYLPGAHLAGLSSLPRVVETLAARPQIQERLGEQIAEVLNVELEPRGVLVVIDASHGCMSDRGVGQKNARAVTVASRGELSDPVNRADLMALFGGAR